MAICHRCGQDNPAVAHFCFACGAPLEAGASRREERKVVTVLFADLVGFTARAEEGDIIVTGDVVNTAARLQQAAPVDTVVVGETTYRATRGRVEYEELEPATVKGKAEPVAAWRATALQLRPVEPTHRAPFIGREQDLALLTQTFARTLREKSVQLVTVAGEAGGGESPLLAEVRRTLSPSGGDGMWRRGRCVSYRGGGTFLGLGEVVKSHAG